MDGEGGGGGGRLDEQKIVLIKSALALVIEQFVLFILDKCNLKDKTMFNNIPKKIKGV